MEKAGYENLCCLRCIQARDTNFGTNWRVPRGSTKGQLERGKSCRVPEVSGWCAGCSGYRRAF
ncbi:Protein BUD31 [Fasciolopsis buskii]|uniref:Protein BUD31 n=1 Tax=Fasciolopsis buskii TaxID=27845 RepID=A0A8E0VMR4_9TREM|nr:Protein BUD31 [Fasciolopsis buski]